MSELESPFAKESRDIRERTLAQRVLQTEAQAVEELERAESIIVEKIEEAIAQATQKYEDGFKPFGNVDFPLNRTLVGPERAMAHLGPIVDRIASTAYPQWTIRLLIGTHYSEGYSISNLEAAPKVS